MYGIDQNFDYIGNDLWEWSVRIKGGDEELDQIDKVIWYLHHTFKNPVVTITDRETQFELKRRGWGVFQLRAELILDDGSKKTLTHWLELAYPDEEVSPAINKGITTVKKKVFLSYGAEDRKLVSQVRGKLEAWGYEILDSSDAEPGLPLDAVVNKMVRDSDLVMGFITSDFASPLVVSELNRANQSEKPVLAIVMPGLEQPYGLDEDLNRIEFNLDSEYAGEELADLLSKFQP
jgi:hypothetical protein